MVRERNPENAAIVRSIGKSAEAWFRRLRPYIKPAYRRAYRALMARGLSQRKAGEPIVVCDFSNPAIDAVGGRYYFSLVRDLIDAGYFPVFVAHRVTLSTFGISRMKSRLLGERFGVVPSLKTLDEPYVLLTDSFDLSASHASKIIRVDYENRIAVKQSELAFPVFVHPQIASQNRLPYSYELNAERSARLFFGGNTSEGKYDKNVIGEVYHMLTRREMLTVVREEITEPNIFRPESAVQWLESNEPHPFVLCETQICKIPPDRWLEALSKADFFLACPGVGMPLCHNLIEALAAGTIPILQYARYLSPPLEDGVNGLCFDDEDSLRRVVSRLQTMDRSEILKLREGVRTYFNNHLAPGRFTQKMVSMPIETLLLNSYRIPR